MKLIKKALKFLKEHGLKRFTRRLFTYPLERVKIELSKRRHVFRPYLNKKEIRYIIGQMREKPLISILMPVYNVPPEFLEKAIHSVINQYYPNWELCIADDCSTNQDTRITLQKFAALNSRIKVTFLDANVGIAEATNAAAKTATGDYFSFMDHDDELTHDALFETIKAIKNHGVDLVYSDEAVINPQGLILNIHFKPDFNFELFLSHNYITHFVTVKREIFFKVNGIETKYNGAQDYQFLLKVIRETKKIHHIPRVLYYWRAIPSSSASGFAAKPYADKAGKMALEDFVKKENLKAEVFYSRFPYIYQMRWKIEKEPLVSIIIPFKDKAYLLERCVLAIHQKTNYKNYEILAVSNNSMEKETFDLVTELTREKKIRFLEFNEPFNYPNINNFAVGKARGKHLVFMNNDIEVVTPDWIELMLEHSQRPEIGAVGALLLYPGDYRIQHAGLVVGISNYAGHVHHSVQYGAPGFMAKLVSIQAVSAVTAALMMVEKKKFQMVGGFNKDFAVGVNDVDLSLRLMYQGFRNIFTPYAVALHRESATRGLEDTPEKIKRFESELALFRKMHQKILEAGDPYYNPNLTQIGTLFEVASAAEMKRWREKQRNECALKYP